MKIPMYHGDEYARQDAAIFRMSHGGLKALYYRRKFEGTNVRIRTAGALRIRSRVIPGRWILNRAGTFWSFYTEPARKFVVPIPSNEVYWARGCSSRCADFETFGGEQRTSWRTVRTERECMACGKMFPRQQSSAWDHCCECICRWSAEMKTRDEIDIEAWFRPERVSIRADREGPSNNRWLRKFVAKEKFTRAEFKALSARLGNLVLRQLGATGSGPRCSPGDWARQFYRQYSAPLQAMQ